MYNNLDKFARDQCDEYGNYHCNDMNQAYDCRFSNKLTNALKCNECSMCANAKYCIHCKKCSNIINSGCCLESQNLNNKFFIINNVQYTPEGYYNYMLEHYKIPNGLILCNICSAIVKWDYVNKNIAKEVNMDIDLEQTYKFVHSTVESLPRTIHVSNCLNILKRFDDIVKKYVTI